MIVYALYRNNDLLFDLCIVVIVSVNWCTLFLLLLLFSMYYFFMMSIAMRLVLKMYIQFVLHV